LYYLLNNKPIPDTKNKIKLLYSLIWTPKKTNSFLRESVLILKYTEHDCDRRYQIMMETLDGIKKYVDENVILEDDLYSYYLNNR
jgi:hypothetical protein